MFSWHFKCLKWPAGQRVNKVAILDENPTGFSRLIFTQVKLELQTVSFPVTVSVRYYGLSWTPVYSPTSFVPLFIYIIARSCVYESRVFLNFHVTDKLLVLLHDLWAYPR